jgi:prophage regulatory protein
VANTGPFRMTSQHQIPTSVDFHANSLIRLSDVLKLIPVGKSTWWAGVKAGRYPPAIKLGPGITAWRFADVRALAETGITVKE